MTIAGDIMLINKIPFFMTISRRIKSGTAEMITSQTTATLLAAIKQVKSVYMKWGFKITHIMLDSQFVLLRGNAAALGITLNVVSQDKHVPKAKRYIHTVKEWTQCIYNNTTIHKDSASHHNRNGICQCLLAQQVPSH
jgi:hypothetical protein